MHLIFSVKYRSSSAGRTAFIWHFRLKVRTAVPQAANGIAKFSSVTTLGGVKVAYQVHALKIRVRLPAEPPRQTFL